jgi:DNA-directed RNA polymerase sigma subunit (sigma70/sigma32)
MDELTPILRSFDDSPQLTRAEELQFWTHWQRTGCRQALEALVRSVAPLAFKTARRYRCKGVPLSDLYQVALVAVNAASSAVTG